MALKYYQKAFNSVGTAAALEKLKGQVIEKTCKILLDIYKGRTKRIVLDRSS